MSQIFTEAVSLDYKIMSSPNWIEQGLKQDKKKVYTLNEFENRFYMSFSLKATEMVKVKGHRFYPLLEDMVAIIWAMEYMNFDYEKFFLPSSPNKLMNNYRKVKKLDFEEGTTRNYRLDAQMYSLISSAHNEISVRLKNGQMQSSGSSSMQPLTKIRNRTGISTKSFLVQSNEHFGL